MTDKSNSDRVTNKQLYEELAKVPNRREMWLVVAASSTVANLATTYITHLSPPQQAAALARFASHLFS